MGYHAWLFFFFFQAEDGIRDKLVTGVQTCALPILRSSVAGVSLNLKRIAGTRSTPDTAALEASGAPAASSAPAAAMGAFKAPKLRRDRSFARSARTARAWRRHTPSLRKSNPLISRRMRGGGACWARVAPGTLSAQTTATNTSERGVTGILGA